MATRGLDQEVRRIFKTIRTGVSLVNAEVRYVYRAVFYGFIHKYRIHCTPQ